MATRKKAQAGKPTARAAKPRTRKATPTKASASRPAARAAAKPRTRKATPTKKASASRPAARGSAKPPSRKATPDKKVGASRSVVRGAAKPPSRKATPDKAAGAQETAKQAATLRKSRTIAQLRREKVPVLESLPCIEDGGEAKVRSLDAVVDRAIALLAVAARGVHAPPEFLAWYQREFGLLRKLSAEEKAFWKEAKPAPRRLAKFSWRWEALAVLLWSLGFIPKLGRPTTPVDPSELVLIIKERGPVQLRAEARLRSPEELLDFADLIYRYHWAVRDAELNGRASPSELNPDIVMEWDYAARWLVGYSGQKWDDVTLDT